MAKIYIPETRKALNPGFGILLLAWTLIAGAAYTRHLLLIAAVQGNVWTDFAGWLTSFYPWVLLSPWVFRLEAQFPLPHRNWLKHLGWLVLASLGFTYVGFVLSLVLVVPLHVFFGQSFYLASHWWLVPPCAFLLQQSSYWLSYAGASIVRNLVEREENERRATQIALEKSELENSLRMAELETMRMRLNPHFLFNSLQNISVLARQDPDTASKMLTRLGDLLRSAIGKGAEAETTLSAELELTRAYVAVEQMRFQDRLTVLFEIEPGLDLALVPSFLLQPLIENAIQHGLRAQQKKGLITIRASRQFQQLQLSVSDNGSGVKESDLEMGIGLGSTSGRLERMYPGEHSFEIRSRVEDGAENGTVVSIALPLRWQQNSSQEAKRELIAAVDRG